MKYSLFLFLLGLIFLAEAQQFNDFERGKNEARFVFYNTENLFDIVDDSIKRDEDFTPDGAKHWTEGKYYKKQNNLGKVLVSVGGWNLPELVALGEIENKKVLYDLTNNTILEGKGYQIVHYESPDRRGIDVGFIYLKEKIKVLNSQAIQVNFPWDKSYKTRDILYSRLLLFETDTLHFFVCHWPSKWGGHLETDKSRFFVGNLLKEKVDEIVGTNKNANILIMGDLNDTPLDESVKDGLGAKNDTTGIKDAELYNLSSDWVKLKRGTHKYQDEWSVIDHVIVSYGMVQEKRTLQVKDGQAYIYDPDFLLEKDAKYFDSKPYRSYVGMKYNGGYSDHLPVYVDLKLNN
ncbi:MAG: endonuclease [Crocinitomicaceae bacterium]|nr:endonuclease [Crocinitomicaceae bacterium]|tara:strand:- start:15147 stop:16190 length:1044 start_codon:yes stop_codon:yes gene_type:complete